MLEPSAALPVKLVAGLAACVAGVFIALGFTGPWKILELKGFDALTVATAPGQSSLPITIIAIDEASMKQVGRQLPWPRSIHARLIDQLTKAGALVIAFDVLFSEPANDPEEDRALADAIRRSAKSVVIASDFVYQESVYARQWLRVDPLPAFMTAGAANGYALVKQDPDLVVRQVPEGGDAFWRAIRRRADERQPGLLDVGEPPAGAMIRYDGRDRTFPYVSYYQALQADTHLPPDTFKDQIVIIGRDIKSTTTQGTSQADLFATPFTSTTGWLTPGVEIHANALETAIRGAAISPAPASWTVALVLAAAAACALAMRRWRPVASAAMALALIAALGTIDAALFVKISMYPRRWSTT